MQHLVEAAAQAAQEKATAENELKAKQAQFNATHAALIDRVAVVKQNAKQADAELRDFATDQFAQDGEKKPHPAVTFKMFATVDYDADYALEWAKKYAHCALAIDGKKYEFLLKSGLFEDMPGTIGEEANPTVKRDLSAYLPLSEHD